MSFNIWMYLVYLLLIVSFIRGYENLSRRNATSVLQSSDYMERYAEYGIDGDTRQIEKYCAHTAVNQSEAWFQVDLGEPFSLHNVRIVYRDEGEGIWRPYRFRYFYLDVSNSSANGSSEKERIRCYQDNTTQPDIPPSKINITCTYFARYVIIGNDYFGNDTHSTGPVLEICEIEIFGCSIRCNGKCGTTGYCDECNTNLWGENCNRSCPDHCNGSICNRNTDCDAFHYGENCKESCGQGCINRTCFANNGTCTLGCVEKFDYPKCNSEYHLMTLSNEEANTAPYIGAGIGAFLLLISVLFIAISVYRLRRKKRSNSTSIVDARISKRDLKALEHQTNEPDVDDPEVKIPDVSVYKNECVVNDIAVADLLHVIKDNEASQNKSFMAEFKSLPEGEAFDCRVGRLEENRPKNRYKTTFPYDNSRVELSLEDGFTCDYINANYIQNLDRKREYIACQGPKEKTLIDHWRMIWQENIEYIVMLTNLIEGPKKKCHQYWPSEHEELELYPFCVTLVEEKVYANYVIRILNLKKREVTCSRTVVQFHYTRWPDHGTPIPLDLVIFHRHFRHKMNPTQHPILVHCSAGVGRTGTFIALDVLSRYGKDNGRVNVIEYVKAMRKDRMTMIQNVEQYIFLHHALFEFFRRQGRFTKREDFLNACRGIAKRETMKEITNEFNELSALKPVYELKDYITGRKHLHLNKTQSVLPVEQYLVFLRSHLPGRNAYYNAVTVSSFTRAEEFISAQLPVTDAVIDLVRLLVDQESNFLISLNPLANIKEMKKWVDEDVKQILLKPYEINKSTQSTLNGIKKTTVKIKGKEKLAHEVHIFECLDWSPDKVLPGDTSSLINLIKQLSFDRRSEANGPMTVISKDGATCCSVFMAVYNALEQLRQDDEVDISTIVQQLQCRRPEMIITKEEYEFCLRAVCDFLNMDNVYANT